MQLSTLLILIETPKCNVQKLFAPSLRNKHRNRTKDAKTKTGTAQSVRCSPSLLRNCDRPIRVDAAVSTRRILCITWHSGYRVKISSGMFTSAHVHQFCKARLVLIDIRKLGSYRLTLKHLTRHFYCHRLTPWTQITLFWSFSSPLFHLIL